MIKISQILIEYGDFFQITKMGLDVKKNIIK